MEELEIEMEPLLRGPATLTFEIKKNNWSDQVMFEGAGSPEITLTVPNLGPSVLNPGVKLEITTERDAIRSLEHDFAPWLTGEQLLKYYEDRTLTEEQHRAMVNALNDKAKTVPENVKTEFLKSGVINRECPSHESLMKIMYKLHPELDLIPTADLFERMKKELKPTDKRQYGKKVPKDKRPKNEFAWKSGYLYHDGVCTYITVNSIEKAWNGLVRLLGKKRAIKMLTKVILERLRDNEL